MKVQLISIYNNLRKVSVDLAKQYNVPAKQSFRTIDNYSKESEILKGIEEVTNFIKHPQYAYLSNNKNNKNKNNNNNNKQVIN